MSDLTLCFKVVRHPRQDSELRWSLFAPLKYEIAYRPGRNAGPMVEGTKIYAFKTQRDALRFANVCRCGTSDFVEVWLALADNARPCKWVSAPSFPNRHKLCDDFWSRSKVGDPSIGSYWVDEAMTGTIECEAVMLVSLLDRAKGSGDKPHHDLYGESA